LCLLFLVSQGFEYRSYRDGNCKSPNISPQNLKINKCVKAYKPKCEFKDTITMELYYDHNRCTRRINHLKKYSLKNEKCTWNAQIRTYEKVKIGDACSNAPAGEGGSAVEYYTLVSEKKECRGKESSTKVPIKTAEKDCAKHCQKKSNMFAVGRASRCYRTYCMCLCEIDGKKNGQCKSGSYYTPHYDLYKYTGSSAETELGNSEIDAEVGWSELSVGAEKCVESDSGLWGMIVNFGQLVIKKVKKRGLAKKEGLKAGMKIVSFNGGNVLEKRHQRKTFKKLFKGKMIKELCFEVEDEPEPVKPVDPAMSDSDDTEELDSDDPEEELPGECTYKISSAHKDDCEALDDKDACEDYSKPKFPFGVTHPCKYIYIGTCTSETHSTECGQFTNEKEQCEGHADSNDSGELINVCKFNPGEVFEGCQGVNKKPCIFPFEDPDDGETYHQCRPTGDDTERYECATNTNPDTLTLSNCNMDTCVVENSNEQELLTDLTNNCKLNDDYECVQIDSSGPKCFVNEKNFKCEEVRTVEPAAVGEAISNFVSHGLMYVMAAIILGVLGFFAGKYVGNKHKQNSYVDAGALIEM